MKSLLTRPRRWLWTTALAVALLPAVALADDWPMFRSDATRTGVVGNADTANGASPWVFPTGGPIESSPAVVGGTVFVGSNDGNVFAIDTASHEPLWTYQTGGPVVSSPAVADGWVFVGSALGFYQIPVAGGEVQVLYMEGAVDSSPAVEGGWVYFVTESGVLKGVDYASAGTDDDWDYTLPDSTSPSSSPAVMGDNVYVFSGSELVIMPAEGGDVTTRPLPRGGAGDATPAIHGGMIYFVGAADGVVYAIPPDGQSVCTSSESIPLALPGSSPAVSDEGIVYVTDDLNLYFVPLDRWSYCSDIAADAAGAAPERAQRASSPTIAGSTIFVGTPDGAFYWDSSLNVSDNLRIDQPGAAVVSSPAVANGIVYIGCTDGNLYALPIPTE